MTRILAFQPAAQVDFTVSLQVTADPRGALAVNANWLVETGLAGIDKQKERICGVGMDVHAARLPAHLTGRPVAAGTGLATR